MQNLDRLERSAHAGGRTAVAGTAEPKMSGESETQPRFVSLRWSVSAATLSGRRRDIQAFLVALLATGASGSAAGADPHARWGATQYRRRGAARTVRSDYSVLGSGVQGPGRLRLCGGRHMGRF